jgi:hypothetical protein
MLIGLGIRLALVFALIAAVVAVPLVTSYRSRCRDGRQVEAHWSFSVPGHQERRPHCTRPEQGLHYLARKVGVG